MYGDCLEINTGLQGLLIEQNSCLYVDNYQFYIIREDDILLEVNGVNVEKIKHQDVVDKIR